MITTTALLTLQGAHGNRLWDTVAGAGAVAEGGQGTGDDPRSGSAGLHGGHHLPGVGLRTVELGRVEVGLPVVASDGKQVAP